jgi:serine/threonine protein kinase
MAEIILKGTNDIYRFDPEQVESIIGKGGMGVVFKGISIEQNRPVAIKVLYREITSNVSNIERERQSASINLHHRNLVDMMDFIELNGIYHIVSEFLVGKTLHRFIEEKKEKGRRVTELEAREIINPILEGLDALHKNGIIHRDIDPSNIFICEDGTIKIMDFGIAKISDGKRKSLTGIGTILGKPHYSPPEQIRGESGKVSPASDLYSLGITYYEMLTGVPPFNATNEYDLMKMQIEKSLPTNSFIPATLFEVIQKATEKNHLKRFQTSQAFLDALESIYSIKTIHLKKSINWVPFIIVSSVLFIVLIFGFIIAYNNIENMADLTLKNKALIKEVANGQIKINQLEKENSSLQREIPSLQNSVMQLQAIISNTRTNLQSNYSSQSSSSAEYIPAEYMFRKNIAYGFADIYESAQCNKVKFTLSKGDIVYVIREVQTGIYSIYTSKYSSYGYIRRVSLDWSNSNY